MIFSIWIRPSWTDSMPAASWTSWRAAASGSAQGRGAANFVTFYRFRVGGPQLPSSDYLAQSRAGRRRRGPHSPDIRSGAQCPTAASRPATGRRPRRRDGRSGNRLKFRSGPSAHLAKHDLQSCQLDRLNHCYPRVATAAFFNKIGPRADTSALSPPARWIRTDTPGSFVVFAIGSKSRDLRRSCLRQAVQSGGRCQVRRALSCSDPVATER